jgi:predicted urease superfamily metal-dependent hydrolase
LPSGYPILKTGLADDDRNKSAKEMEVICVVFVKAVVCVGVFGVGGDEKIEAVILIEMPVNEINQILCHTQRLVLQNTTVGVGESGWVTGPRL